MYVKWNKHAKKTTKMTWMFTHQRSIEWREQVNDLKPPQWVNQHIRECMIKRLNYWIKATNIGIAWKNVYGRKDKLSEQTRNKGMTWNEMDMETNETKRNKMKFNGNEPENEKEHAWVN